mmetsp:Transcript_52469/g.104270  ORF Transcript_52469/g.104270 Transcript_52469/m.104270 type:complete len:208 (+) Transcript_52469:553-1176(+)
MWQLVRAPTALGDGVASELLDRKADAAHTVAIIGHRGEGPESKGGVLRHGGGAEGADDVCLNLVLKQRPGQAQVRAQGSHHESCRYHRRDEHFPSPLPPCLRLQHRRRDQGQHAAQQRLEEASRPRKHVDGGEGAAASPDSEQLQSEGSAKDDADGRRKLLAERIAEDNEGEATHGDVCHKIDGEEEGDLRGAHVFVTHSQPPRGGV